MGQLNFEAQDFAEMAISPFLELGAYEALWDEGKASFERIAKRFAKEPGAIPSDFVEPSRATKYANDVHQKLIDAEIQPYGVRVHGAAEYPQRLRDAEYPVEFLYYRGWWDLVNSLRSICVVGSRNPSPEGIRRTRRLVRSLLEDDFTIVSGLAKGIDTVAHTTTIDEGGRTIGVLGTPIFRVYPKENEKLQQQIADKYLLISQVPVIRYERATNPTANRHFFPARNITMSALTDATVIVEAGETSRTLIQARAALYQERKLFILDSCFQSPNLTWPARYEKQGAIRVRDYDDIRRQFIPERIH